MADGMTPAYDAFSQTRDTGTKERVAERKRVDTYTDPNRYQMPPSRRLYVNADSGRFQEVTQHNSLGQLADALAKVKPQLMNYLANKEVEKNKAEIEEGRKAAISRTAYEANDPFLVDSEWRRYGYNKQQALMLGEDLGTKLAQDSQLKNPEQDYDQWYEEWKLQNLSYNTAVTDIEAEHVGAFNRGFESKNQISKDNAEIRSFKDEANKYESTAVENLTRSLEEQLENNPDSIDGALDELWLKTVRTENQVLSRWTNEQWGDLSFNAIEHFIEQKMLTGEYKDIDRIFTMLDTVRRGENGELPTFAKDKKYGPKVTELKGKVLDARTKLRNAEVKAEDDKEKAITALTNQATKEIKIAVGEFEEMFSVLKDPNQAKLIKIRSKKSSDKFREYANEIKESNPDLPNNEVYAQAIEKTLTYIEDQKWMDPNYKAEVELLKKQQEDSNQAYNTFTYGADAVPDSLTAESFTTDKFASERAGEIYNHFMTAPPGSPEPEIAGVPWSKLSDFHRNAILKKGLAWTLENNIKADTENLKIASTTVAAGADAEKQLNPKNLDQTLTAAEGEREKAAGEFNTAQQAYINESEQRRIEEDIKRTNMNKRQRSEEIAKRNQERHWNQEYLDRIEAWHTVPEIANKFGYYSDEQRTATEEFHKDYVEPTERPSEGVPGITPPTFKPNKTIKEGVDTLIDQITERNKDVAEQREIWEQYTLGKGIIPFNPRPTEYNTKKGRADETVVISESGNVDTSGNNYGNLKTADAKHFRSFDNKKDATMAYVKQIFRYVTGQGPAQGKPAKNIEDIIAFWRPPSDRRGSKDISQKDYVDIVAKAAGIKPKDLLKVETLTPEIYAGILHGISIVENGRNNATSKEEILRYLQ